VSLRAYRSLGEHYVYGYKEMEAVQKLTSRALLDSSVSNPSADKVATVVVDVVELFPGGSNMFEDTPVKYEAEMYALDMESGDVLFHNHYAESVEWARRCDFSCVPWPSAVQAKYDAINRVNDRFIADLYSVEAKGGAVSDEGRIHGTLGNVYVDFADTYAVANWRYRHRAGQDFQNFMFDVLVKLQTGVTVSLLHGKYFSHHKDTTYDVRISISDIDDYGGGFFSRGDSGYCGTASILKNGREVGVVELNESDLPAPLTVDAINKVFFDKITEYFDGLRS